MAKKTKVEEVEYVIVPQGHDLTYQDDYEPDEAYIQGQIQAEIAKAAEKARVQAQIAQEKRRQEEASRPKPPPEPEEPTDWQKFWRHPAGKAVVIGGIAVGTLFASKYLFRIVGNSVAEFNQMRQSFKGAAG